MSSKESSILRRDYWKSTTWHVATCPDLRRVLVGTVSMSSRRAGPRRLSVYSNVWQIPQIRNTFADRCGMVWYKVSEHVYEGFGRNCAG